MQPKLDQKTIVQTSGIFRLPLEIFFEIFSYLAHHRCFIREHYYGREMYTRIRKEHVERTIVIRRLTMTCRPLRNLLLPLLWTDAEGCIAHIPYDHNAKRGGEGSHLYAQCAYLSSNPAIAVHVRSFSVYLHLSLSPEDLMIKFVDCLVRLPNLRTLEILAAGPRLPISKALRRKYATFPSIRELRITPACHHFIRNCPNLESLTFARSLDTHAPATILSHGKGLRRIAGVPVHRSRGMHAVGSGCPNLREIGIIGSIRSCRTYLGTLKQLKHLTIVDADLDQGSEPHDSEWEEAREGWKRELISLLKECPSTDRKVLKWKVVQRRLLAHGAGNTYDVVENEEFEVSRKTSL